MSHMEYTTTRHPRSGEVYAVEMTVTGEDETDAIETVMTRVAGPLRQTERGVEDDDGNPLDADGLCDLINNQYDPDSRDDAAWLRRELERAS